MKRIFTLIAPRSRSTKVSRDLLAITLIAVLAVLAELRFDLLDRLFQPARNRASELTNIVLELAFILALAFTIFAWRRGHDLRLENHERVLAEQQYRTLFESANDPILIFRPADQVIVAANARAGDLYGLPRDALIGRSLQDFTTDAARGEQAVSTLLALPHDQPLDAFEFTQRRADGTRIHILARASVIDYRGHPAILTINRDITERMRAEQAVRESDVRKGAMLDAALDCIISVDHTGAIIEFNTAAEQTFGFQRSAVIGKDMAAIIIPPALRAQHQYGFARYLATGCATILNQRLELTAMRADGREFPVELAISRVPLEGAPIFTAFLRDLTAHKQAEAAVAATERRFQAMVERSTEGIVLFDAAFQRTYVSPSTAAVLGYTPEEYRQLRRDELFHPDDVERMGTVYHDLAAQPGATTTAEARVRHKDGMWRWLEIVYTNLLNDADVRAVVANYRDITERKQDAEELETRERRFRALVERSFEGISATDAQGIITYTSQSSERVSGRKPEEVIGRHMLEFIHPDDRQQVIEAMVTASPPAGASRNLEIRSLHADGTWRWIETTGTNLLDDPSVRAIVTNFRDITARKQAEAVLLRQNTYLTALHETTLGLLNRRDVTDLLDAILLRAGTLLGAPDGLIFWTQAGPEERPTRLGMGIFHDDPRPPVRRGDGLIGTVWETGELLVLNDYQQWPERRTGDLRDTIHAAVAVPLVADRQVIGVISLVHLQPARIFADDEVAVLMRFADLAAIVLQNAHFSAQMQESEERYRTLIEVSPEPILVHRDERHVFANAAAVQLYRAADAADLIARSMYDLIPPTVNADARRLIFESYTERQPIGPLDVAILRLDGEQVEVELQSIPIMYQDEPATLTVLHDVTARKQAERRVRESEERYRLMFDSNPLPMWVFDTETFRFLAVNDAATTHYGYSAIEFLAMTVADIRPPEELPALRAYLATYTGRYQPSGIWRHRKKDGSLVEMEITSYQMDFEGRPARLVVANDVTERQRAEAALRHHALHDALTGLPNRTLFAERLARALDRAKRDPAYRFAVLYLDFDRFKTINDSLGHLEGDRVLIEGARRLACEVRLQDTLARLGGDEFVVLLEELAADDDPVAIARRLSHVLTAPIALRGQEVVIGASVGILHGAEHYHRPEELIRDADIAMYQAKARGEGEPVVFDAAMHARAVARLYLESELRRAVEQREFTLYYQPIVALATGKIVGFEALARWRHPAIGMIAPADFIPVAEETGLIVPLGRWVLRAACRQLCAWDACTPAAATLIVSVNVAARELRQADFATSVTTILRETGLAPHRLALEITESALIEETETINATLRDLHGAGVRIHLDDFGMGYSSLSYLHRFPLDAVKIDRSFVSTSEHDEIANRGIVEAIIALAHTLQIAVTAEGIETAKQEQTLETLACGYGQGNHFSPPMTPASARLLLEEQMGQERPMNH